MVFKELSDELTKKRLLRFHKSQNSKPLLLGQELNYQEIEDTDKESWHLFEELMMEKSFTYESFLKREFFGQSVK